MNRMQKHNLYNIKRSFEKKTGIRLIEAMSLQPEEEKAPRKRIPRMALVAAIVAVFLTLTAFTVSAFSRWVGDSLTMTASYYGDGIVWVEITNQSDRELRLEPRIKLCYYSTQELVESTGEEPYIENLTIPANSTEKVRLDLRRTYDIAALENSKNDFYYLQVTNDGFLTGQTWSCMVSFRVSDYVTPYYELSDTRCLEGTLPSLRSYFLNFTPDIFARWPDAFDYLELVQAELEKLDGKLVRTCGTQIFFDAQDWMVSSSWSTFDSYNKLLGVDDSEYYTAISVMMPCPRDNGQDNGGWNMPLFYLYEYAKADIGSPRDYAFIRGNLLNFEEMEPYKVYDDGEYVVYEMHHLFYTDLKTYVQDMLLQRDDMYLDDRIWKRIETIYAHWGDYENLTGYLYRLGEGTERRKLTMPDVIGMSRKGDALTYEDIAPYRVGIDGHTILESACGASYTIDGRYELFYAMHLDGTFRGWYLIHKPTGDSIEIRRESVEAFLEEHGQPLPRCACEAVEPGMKQYYGWTVTEDVKEYHGWTVTMEWLLEMGNDIKAADFACACEYRQDEAEGLDTHIQIYPIYDHVGFYVLDCWSEENHKWMLYLVHAQSGDRCDLETENAWAFVTAHGGSQ